MRKVAQERIATDHEEMSFRMTDGSTVKLEKGWRWVSAPGRNNREITACGNGQKVGSSQRLYFELPDERIVFRFCAPEIPEEESDESSS